MKAPAKAAYAVPIITMAQNRQSERDRHDAEQDLKRMWKPKRRSGNCWKNAIIII